ncbi:MAG TPA: hypothetical protein VGB76_06535 [Pyrinomonadaceae bacterium]|jgi:uncharacterized protein YfeS
MSRDEDEDFEELSRDRSHPRAAQLLTDEFFWDCVDENTPFGNDTGADALAFFREWRRAHPHTNAPEFLAEILGEVSEVPDAHRDAVEPERVQELLAESEYDVSVLDDTVIAVAFGQIVLEGRVDAEIKRRALLALQRQASPAVIRHRGWVSSAERIERLERMREVLGGL